MSFTTAVSLLALAVSCLSLLAVLAIRREQHRLGAYVTTGIGRTVEPLSEPSETEAIDLRSVGGNSVLGATVLRVDGVCLACKTVIEYLASLPSDFRRDVVVVGPDGWSPPKDVQAKLSVIADSATLEQLPGPWVPTMLAIDQSGVVLDLRPVADERDVDDFLASVVAATNTPRAE